MENTSLYKNENGSVVVLAMIMVVLLGLLGMAVSRTSSIDVQVASNDTRAVKDLYQAESGDYWALEATSTWMTNTFLTQSTAASYGPQDMDLDNDGNNDVKLEIRCIKSSGPGISTFSDGANNLPTLEHIAPPPVGSKYGLKNFEIRRYGITSTTLGTNSQVQIGAYKVFNKF